MIKNPGPLAKKKKKSTINSAGNYTKPKLRASIVKKWIAGTKGGKAGENSARKMQGAAKEYKARGGGYTT
jgi:hypothetical protein